MTLDQIRYFVAVAELQHLGQAADRLRISPSAVSHAIVAIESEIGRELFLRERKRLKLNDHGSFFLKSAREILEKVNQLKLNVSKNVINFTGTIKIASTSTIISHLITPAWGTVSKYFPQANIEFIEIRSSMAADLCFEGLADLAICFKKIDYDILESRDLRAGDLFLCARKSHPLAKLTGKAQKIGLSRFPVVVPRRIDGAHRGYDCNLLTVLGIAHSAGSYFFDSYDVAHSIMLNSFAWGALPDFVLEHFSKDLIVLDRNNSIDSYRISAIYRKTNYISEPIRALLDEIQQNHI